MEDQSVVTTLRSRIESLLRATKREGVEDLLSYLERRGYFTKPCGPHHDMRGGLAWHSMEVLFRMIEANQLDIPLSSLIVVALLHELNRLSRNNFEQVAGSTAVTIITKKAKFALLPTEREAILLQNYSSSQLARMYDVPSCQIGNPIRSILRYANKKSIESPKAWEDLLAMMDGKYQSPEKETDNVQPNPRYFAAIYNQRIKPYRDLYQGLNQGLNQDVVPAPIPAVKNKPTSTAQMEEALSYMAENGIDMYVFYEFLSNRIDQHHYRYYKRGVSEDQKIEMDGRLRELCANGASAATLAELIYGRENKHIFDQNWKVSKVYRELEEFFGLKLKLNSLQKAVQDVE